VAIDLNNYVDEVTAYLNEAGLVATGESLNQAVRAEFADQAHRCRIASAQRAAGVTADELPPVLIEALCRRVAHNLALRNLPLGVQATVADAAVATNVVAGYDAEVRRLEAPYRRRTVG
jgi:hypothetical protein